MDFVLASNNKKKLDELKRILLPLGVNVISAKDMGIDLHDIKETGMTFAENALIKAEFILKLTNLPSIGDDSGLMVDALGGEPGIYSARYAGPFASDSDRIKKLLFNMKNVKSEDRDAKFVCSICCLFPDGRKITANGECRGKIGFEPVGSNGFGYDPIFITKYGKTFAQLNSDEKDKTSHRGNALRILSDKLKKHEIEETVYDNK